MPSAGGQEQLEQQLVAPAEPVEPGHRLREPFVRRMADQGLAHADREAGREGRCGPPLGHRPAAEPGRLREQCLVAGIVGVLGKIDIDARAGAARAARLDLDVPGTQGIVERAGGHRELEAAAPDRPAALELVETEIDPGVCQLGERTFEPLPPDQASQVARRDPGMRHQLTVGALGPCEDRVLGQRQESLGPRRDVPAQLLKHHLRIDGGAQERAQVAGEPAQEPHLIDRGAERAACPCRQPATPAPASAAAMACRAGPTVVVCRVGRRERLAGRCSG